MKIIDISIPLHSHTVIYPHNPAVTIETVRTVAQHGSQVSNIIMGSHTGTHLDAASHVFEGGLSVDAFPLDVFIGPCRVIDVTHRKAGEVIEVSDIEDQHITAGERLLFKTNNSARGFEMFYDDFVALSGDAAEFLAAKNVALCGIDYLSIQKRGSSDHRAHTALLERGIAILEGIDLSHVAAGTYELYCPPVKFVGLDGAPTRAILISR